MFDLGFLGGGQLARMSIQAAQRIGLRCLSLDPGIDTPASQIAEAVQGRLDDPERIAEVFRRSERVTLENEFIPGKAIREALQLSGRDEEVLMPGVETLETIQDKLLQRQTLAAAGVASPKAIPLTDADEAIAAIGLPMVLKARYGGYDGKGTRYARTREELVEHAPLWQDGGWLAEGFVSFKRELAVMVFVSRSGEAGVFPTMETVQKNHVCDLVYPCDADGSDIALAAVRAVKGVGLFGVELFEDENGGLLVNEIAPRPHNTGHYTLDWGATSQFEQHVRLALGMPLGGVDGGEVCMANLLGQEQPVDVRMATAAALTDPTVHVHWYGKADSRPGRKMGHLNVRAEGSMDLTLLQRARQAQLRFYGEAG